MTLSNSGKFSQKERSTEFPVVWGSEADGGAFLAPPVLSAGAQALVCLGWSWLEKSPVLVAVGSGVYPAPAAVSRACFLRAGEAISKLLAVCPRGAAVPAVFPFLVTYLFCDLSVLIFFFPLILLVINSA